MKLVAHVGCGLDSKKSTADGKNPIRKAKKRLNQMSFLTERGRVCAIREGESARQIRILPELTCFGR